MKIIKVSNLEINIHDGPLGVSVSGGADSAILLYLVMKNATMPVHIYTCSSDEKNRVAPHVALDVIGKCIDLTGNYNIRHHTHFVKSQSLKTLFDPLVMSIQNKEIEYLYTAVTAVPPHSVLSTFNNPTPLLDKRDPGVVRPLYNGFQQRIYSPFFNIDKSYIYKLYEDAGVIESLYPLTRSCESFSLSEGHCGECWWCEERYWAFGRYN